MDLTVLYRPVNQNELDLIVNLKWKKFPPRLSEQPFFYPVTNEEYASEISKRWNVQSYGIGYVTKFFVKTNFINQYTVHNVGGFIHNEYWIPSEDLENFNSNIVGKIEIIKTYTK